MQEIYHSSRFSDRIFGIWETYTKNLLGKGCIMKQLKSVKGKQMDGYFNNLRHEEHSELTIQKYSRDITRFLACSKGRLDKSAIMEWRTALVADGYAPQTINSMLAAVNGLLDYLGRSEQKVKPLKCQRVMFRSKERELTKAEYLRLLDTAKCQGKQRLFLVLQTICATGIRVSELKYITVQAAQNGQATVNCKGKCRVILIPRKLCKELLGWAKGKRITAGPVFQTSGGKTLDRSNIWREMKGLCGAAGVDSRKVFPHNLRHLFAVLFYKVNKDIAKLADILGHTSISTTRIYIMETSAEHERQLAQLGLVV